jgi:hypothetical protein
MGTRRAYKLAQVCPLGKLIIMPTTDLAYGGDTSASTLTLDSLRDLNTIVNVHRSLVRLDEKVRVLEIATKSNSENIDTLTKTAYAIPYLERESTQTKKDLNDLGGRHDKKLHELEIKIEKELNEMGRSIRQEITGSKDGLHKEITNLKDGEIAKLNHAASIAKGICIVVGTLVTGGILVPIVLHFWPR